MTDFRTDFRIRSASLMYPRISRLSSARMRWTAPLANISTTSLASSSGMCSEQASADTSTGQTLSAAQDVHILSVIVLSTAPLFVQDGIHQLAGDGVAVIHKRL